jgi:starch synthase (maltosyl-transferring)
MPLPKTPQPRIQIQAVEPIVDCGRYAVKRTVGDTVEVYATVVKDGHDTLAGAVRVKAPGAKQWQELPLRPYGEDRWGGAFTPDRPGRWQYRVAAWTDRIATWQDELRRKVDAGQEDLAGELSEGALLFGRQVTVEVGLASEAGDRHGEATSQTYEVDVDRVLARFGSWYELFPRSWGGFRGVAEVLPELAALGFDAVYLPPVHPIGHTNRKGKNNTLTPGKDDVGSPWAIGTEV